MSKKSWWEGVWRGTKLQTQTCPPGLPRFDWDTGLAQARRHVPYYSSVGALDAAQADGDDPRQDVEVVVARGCGPGRRGVVWGGGGGRGTGEAAV